jgi:acyl-CoA thioesterase-1
MLQRPNTQLILYLFIWTILSLAGCGGSADIPPASILSSGRVTLAWDDVPGAAAYNVYLSTSPGVTVLNSYKISNATNPLTITDLEPGTTYYFVVTVENDSGQSRKSKEISYTVTDTAGSIAFGDILSPSESDAAASESEIVPAASTPETKTTDKSEPWQRQAAAIQSGNEIIICFGDSLTFGTGAGKGMDYPSQLAKMIRKPVINKGLPGDTTASALRRLNKDVLSKKPDIVLITLGGNDLKNGVSKDAAFDYLKQIVRAIQKQGAKVIIGGLKFPGMDRGFGEGYEDLARQTGAVLIPDIFAGMLDNRNLMSDPIHPNNYGYRIIAQRFYNAIASSEPKTKPTGKDAAPETRDVTLAWDDVPNATSYNIYWSDKPGVTRKNGTKISNVKNPHKLNGLKKGKKYYFVVTAVNASGESKESGEFSFTVGQ